MEKKVIQTIHLVPDIVTSHQADLENLHQSNTPPQKYSRRKSEALSKAGQEIITGNLHPETWALALQQSHGAKAKAKTIYIDIRSAKLIDEKRALRFKETARDNRLINNFRPAQVIAQPTTELENSNTTYWEAILALGSIGTSLSISSAITHAPPYFSLLASLFITTITVLVLKIACLQKPRNQYSISYTSAICALSIITLLVTVISIQLTDDLRIWLN